MADASGWLASGNRVSPPIVIDPLASAREHDAVSANSREERPEITDEKFGHLHGGEVATLGVLVPVGELVLGIEDPPHQWLVPERHEALRPVVGLAPGSRACTASYRKLAAPRAALAEPVDAHEGEEMIQLDRLLRQRPWPGPSTP